jgi:hypothetical protein
MQKPRSTAEMAWITLLLFAVVGLAGWLVWRIEFESEPRGEVQVKSMQGVIRYQARQIEKEL